MAAEQLPLNVRKRLEIAGLFYPLDRSAQRQFARILSKGQKAFESHLAENARELKFEQEIVRDGFILWKDREAGTYECLFRLVDDATDLPTIKNIFDTIVAMNPVFSYAIIHQKKDGEGTYDIFRMSRFSYLEHCNRVKLPKPRQI